MFCAYRNIFTGQMANSKRKKDRQACVLFLHPMFVALLAPPTPLSLFFTLKNLLMYYKLLNCNALIVTSLSHRHTLTQID